MSHLDLNDPYVFATLTMSIIVFVIGLYLFLYRVSAAFQLQHYRISCRLLALSYFITAIFSFVSLIPFKKVVDMQIQTDLALSYTLVIASFQAFIGIMSLIVLLNPRYLTRSRIVKHLVPIVFFSSLLIYATFYIAIAALNIILIIAILLYCGQLIYYAYLFAIEYKKYKQRANNFFSDDEGCRIRWVKRVLYLGFGLGVYVLAAVFYSALNNTIFTIVCTVIYSYIAIEYINYPSRFFSKDGNRHLNLADEEMEESIDPNEVKFDFVPKLEEWIANKGFIHRGITLPEVAYSLGTNQAYLSSYINLYYQQNFRLWISTLRMKEAEDILINKPSVSIDHLGEYLGISTRSSFHRQFQLATGQTPANFRKLNEKCFSSEILSS